MEKVSVEKKKRGRKRIYEPGQSPSAIKKREKSKARLKMLNEMNKQERLEPTTLHGFRFGSIANKHEFEVTEKKLEEANMILDDIPPLEYARRNIQTYKRDKILYDLFGIVFNSSSHRIAYHNNIREEMKNHLKMLCEQSGREYREYEKMFLKTTDEEDSYVGEN